jgi:hypothetical protein
VAALTKIINQIDHDSDQPGVETRLSLKLTDRLQGPQKRFLDGLGGVIGGAGHLISQAIQSVLMVTDQLTEGGQLTRLSLSHELIFVECQELRTYHLTTGST